MKYLTAIASAAIMASCSPHGGERGELVPSSATALADPDLEHFQALINEDYVEPFLAGDVDQWMKILDDDVVGLHNRLPAMEGKPAMRGFGDFVAGNLFVAEMSVTLAGLRHEGEFAYTWGTYSSRLLMRETGEPMPGHREAGKVLFIWKRQADGEWKLVVDMGNELPVAPPS